MSVFLDSFQNVNTPALLARKYNNITNQGNLTFDSSVKSNALQRHTLRRTPGGSSPEFQKNLASTQEWTIGYRLRFATAFPAAWQSFAIFRIAGGEHIRVRIDSAGFIYVQLGNGSTIVSATDASLQVAEWRFLETYVKHAESPDGIIAFKSAGVEIFRFTGDTSPFGGTTIDNVLFDMGPECHICDLYIRDDGENYLNDGICLYHEVDADGDVQQWSPSAGVDHYAMVDDTDPDDDATYLEETTAGQEDTNHVEDLLASGTIRCVQAVSCARTATSAVVKQGIRRGGTSYYGANNGLQLSYQYIHDSWLTDPSGGSWDAAGYNAAQKVINMVS